ncbi:hypothetical protein L226DRAFT_245816 [Lentinus tigrinus ALCF2SS1-7]|uniref:uncharacterized protein n=1 Tax=Lentinus tigrinus ALCF2SS1-7 TaxID=1328758 RepID=UPI001165F868|nr:hypothetical protein L226DRAFT_245816 [Lentinus tigrinus ALCF2SS1-7]
MLVTNQRTVCVVVDVSCDGRGFQASTVRGKYRLSLAPVSATWRQGERIVPDMEGTQPPPEMAREMTRVTIIIRPLALPHCPLAVLVRPSSSPSRARTQSSGNEASQSCADGMRSPKVRTRRRHGVNMNMERRRMEGQKVSEGSVAQSRTEHLTTPQALRSSRSIIDICTHYSV